MVFLVSVMSYNVFHKQVTFVYSFYMICSVWSEFHLRHFHARVFSPKRVPADTMVLGWVNGLSLRVGSIRTGIFTVFEPPGSFCQCSTTSASCVVVFVSCGEVGPIVVGQGVTCGRKPRVRTQCKIYLSSTN